MAAYERTRRKLIAEPRTWLVTGVAGFIGSHLLETLLALNQRVVGVDNFATGKKQNLEEVRRLVKKTQWLRFTFLRGDIRDVALCQRACQGADYVLHQAALGSVPGSIEDPVRSNECNVSGFLNMLVAARDQRVRRFIFASSSSIYGDEPGRMKIESQGGSPLSPYAVTKLANELYAGVFARVYGMEIIGLRYFNVFGPRQDPQGPYAAVIPRWIRAMLDERPIYINGNGSASRDFCYVANAVQANLLAATTTNARAVNQMFNVAVNSRTTLNELFSLLKHKLASVRPEVRNRRAIHRPFPPGDILHSQADISRARRLLGYAPTHTVEQGLNAALDWYCRSNTGAS